MAIDRKAMNKVVFGGTAARLHAALAVERVVRDPSVKCTLQPERRRGEEARPGVRGLEPDTCT